MELDEKNKKRGMGKTRERKLTEASKVLLMYKNYWSIFYRSSTYGLNFYYTV